MATHKEKEKPSQVTKDRLTNLVQQDINECGKIAKYLVQHSGSREVSVPAGATRYRSLIPLVSHV